MSGWCPYHFSQLTLNIMMACLPFEPTWDLCTCSLEELALIVICAGCMPDLCNVINVRAGLFRLVFQGIASPNERSFLNCITWQVARARILCSGQDMAVVPMCVTDAVGAMVLSMYGPPDITVQWAVIC